jgi:hypothetical protein
LGVSYDPQGHPVTGVGSRGAEVNQRDYATGVFGKSVEHINRNLNIEQFGTRGEYGTSRQTFNRDESLGAYKGADGNTYYGDFFYGNLTNPATGKQERSVISGQGSNVINFDRSTTQNTHDGRKFPAKTSESYNQKYEILKSRSESGTNFTRDDSKNFTGGYTYDNYFSAALDEHGFHRAAQAFGRIRGILDDARQYLTIPQGGAKGGKPGPRSAGKGPHVAGGGTTAP